MTDKPKDITRRDFLGQAWTWAGVLAAMGTGFVSLRFLTSQTTNDAFGTTITAGLVDDFPINTVTPFTNGKFYLVRGHDGGFLALYQKCTHLACVVVWQETEKQFYCPCHGSRFQPDGAVLNRPAVQSLSRFPVTFDGEAVLVDTGHLITRDQISSEDIVYPGGGESVS